MKLSRPNLTTVDPEVRAYIEELEAELERLKIKTGTRKMPAPKAASSSTTSSTSDIADLDEPPEPPTTINVITATASGLAKRTPRHLYTRQRRGGMGIFDLQTPEGDNPSLLALADEGQNLLIFTSNARAFRLPVDVIPETPIRARGATILKKIELQPGERLAAILPEQALGYVALLSKRGMVRLLRHHIFGEYMRPGTTLFDANRFGELASACWTPGDGDLFIATRNGRAIRFSEKLVSPLGSLGIRLSEQDTSISITAAYNDSGVFLLSSDGKGTIRLMSGFSANKAPGSSGKSAIHTDRLVSAINVDEMEDIFIISRLSKIIRFRVNEIPAKEGVVQGVVCMSLRSDEPITAATNPISYVL